jgi:pyruvate-ferredoxin/flavodoxin oxidoreductase
VIWKLLIVVSNSPYDDRESQLIGNYHEDMSVQAYFEYDAKKSSGFTISHLRFSSKVKIEAPFRVEDSQGDYVACHNESYVQANKYDVIKFLKRRGTFFLNTAVAAMEDPQKRLEALEQLISPKILRNLALRNINVSCILVSLIEFLGGILIFVFDIL